MNSDAMEFEIAGLRLLCREKDTEIARLTARVEALQEKKAELLDAIDEAIALCYSYTDAVPIASCLPSVLADEILEILPFTEKHAGPDKRH